MLVRQPAPPKTNPRRANRTQPAIKRAGPKPSAAAVPRREPTRIRGVHAGHLRHAPPSSRKTSGRVSRPLSRVVFLTP